MRYYHLAAPDGTERLVARDGGDVYDLSAAGYDRFRSLARDAASADTTLDAIANRHVDDAPTVPLSRIDAQQSRPLVPEEVWAAGVTYEISEQAREAESSMPEIYLDVYDADRPELFFKATPSRTVGPGEAVGVRGDSDWNVPEPELGLVLYEGEIVGYTVGNDVSSRAIEGENPLYLPQAKIYDRCCAIGPCVTSPATIGDPADLDMRMTIERDGETTFSGSTSTSRMARSHGELVSYLTRHNALPELAVLLTGTSLVPDDWFSLEAGDHVAIEIEGIGTLRNDVVPV